MNKLFRTTTTAFLTLTNAWALGFGLWALGFEKSTEEIEQRTTNLVVHLMTVKQVTLSTAGYYHLFTTLLERGFSY
ncbi:hypothetical protein VCHA55O506_10867 [Vibrio chagasii]|nr:hypothetical protein VCHA55O506_10867 [Vibrio chagasii]